MDFYVYLHRRASDGKVFYVGKGRNRRALSKSRRSQYWQNIVNKHGYTIEYVQTGMQEWWAFEMEIQLIEFYGRENLVNLTDGGEGASGFSDETKEKIRLSKMGLKVSEETKEKLRLANLGKKHSKETKARMGAAHIGRKKSPESIEKSRQGNIGKKRSEEYLIKARLRVTSEQTKEKLRNANLGKKYGPETSAKRSIALKGRIFSDEHKRKIGLSQPRTPVECSNGLVFDCIMDAQRWLRLNGFPKAREANIRSVRDGKRNMAYGYKWSAINDEF